MSVIVSDRTSSAQPAVSAEYRLKAVFLYNFLQFVDWPPDAFAEAHSPYVVGVLGVDPFGNVLESTMSNERIKGRRILIRRYRRAEDIDACHILFVSQSEDRRLQRILARLKGAPVLTVGESKDFAERGGMIQFIVGADRVRFRINTDPVDESRLRMSSKLLRVAEEVTGAAEGLR